MYFLMRITNVSVFTCTESPAAAGSMDEGHREFSASRQRPLLGVYTLKALMSSPLIQRLPVSLYYHSFIELSLQETKNEAAETKLIFDISTDAVSGLRVPPML